MVKKKKIVFFTRAGMSRESGLPTFRGEGGVWNEIDYERVATLKSWYGRQRKDVKQRRQAMLDFFNPMRRAILRLHYSLPYLTHAYGRYRPGGSLTSRRMLSRLYLYTFMCKQRIVFLYGDAS